MFYGHIIDGFDFFASVSTKLYMVLFCTNKIKQFSTLPIIEAAGFVNSCFSPMIWVFTVGNCTLHEPIQQAFWYNENYANLLHMTLSCQKCQYSLQSCQQSALQPLISGYQKLRSCFKGFPCKLLLPRPHLAHSPHWFCGLTYPTSEAVQWLYVYRISYDRC